jgi:hypothetical protein
LANTELRELRQLLREHIRIYRIALQTPLSTATERRQCLGRIKTAAMRFIAKPNQQWAERLLRAVDVDDNTRAVIYRHLAKSGIKWTAFSGMKRQLEDLYLPSVPDEPIPPPGQLSLAQQNRVARFAQCVPTVIALAGIDPLVLVPLRRKDGRRSGKWPDPAQANLIAALEPLWCRVTGYSAGLTSIDRAGEEKRCRFAEWLNELLAKLDLSAPSRSRVLDVVREK